MDRLERLRRKLLAGLQRLAWLPPATARLCLGLSFLISGGYKATHLHQAIHYFTSLHIPAAGVMTPFVMVIELSCGALLLVGALTRLVTLPLAVMMAVAIVTAKRGDLKSWSDILLLGEFLYILILGWLAIAGPGQLSIDYLVHRRLSARRPSPATERAPFGVPQPT